MSREISVRQIHGFVSKTDAWCRDGVPESRYSSLFECQELSPQPDSATRGAYCESVASRSHSTPKKALWTEERLSRLQLKLRRDWNRHPFRCSTGQIWTC